MESRIEEMARFAMISLKRHDEGTLAEELKALSIHMEDLLKVDVEGVPPTFSLVDYHPSVLAEDVPSESLCREVVFKFAPSVDGGYFKVPRESEDV